MKEVHLVIYNLLKDKKRGMLLDAACGTGGLGDALSEAGFKVFPVDFLDCPENKSRFVTADIGSSIPYKGEAFDYVICAESLQYIENRERLFSELNRVLKRGGTLIVSLPNILAISSRFYFLRRGYSPHFKPVRTMIENRRWDNVYNPVSFVEVFQLIKRNGLEIKDVFSSRTTLKGWWLYPFIKALYLIGFLFDKNKNKAELIRWLASEELLRGDHLVICSVKGS